MKTKARKRHLRAEHGFNRDTVRIWSNLELKNQHRRYHLDPTGDHLHHDHDHEGF